MFDLAANLLFLVLTATLAVQLGHGAADKFRDQDTTMVLRIPEGWAYDAALAAVWLLVLVTAYTVLRSALEIARDQAMGPPPAGEH
jgi:TRAP-type C4-dicarboxylate transport system permease small subunit